MSECALYSLLNQSKCCIYKPSGAPVYPPVYSPCPVQHTLTVRLCYHTHGKLNFNCWLMHPLTYTHSSAKYLDCMCLCVRGWGCVCVCVCLAYTSEDFHMKTHRYTEDSTPSEDPKTGPRKTLAKNAKNVMFYRLRGVRAPRTSTDFQPYLIYEDIRVLGSISKARGGVCVCVYACVISFL